MKIKSLFFFLSIFLLFTCSNDDENNPTTEVNIRLSNSSDVKFENATFNNINFGDINSSDKTEYKTFERSYGYGSVKITIDGNDYGWIPIDFVGETLLKNGNYTFEYSFDNSTGTLTDELIKD
jgi:hypothetical protein